MQLNNAIEQRWSPLYFSKKEVTREMINLLFEAARRAPSSMNAQPWNYYYAHQNDEAVFNQLVDLLTGANPHWAKHAPVLMVSVAKKKFDYKNRPNGKALHDLGAANISMALQAADMGLQVHQMGGFDAEKALQLLGLALDEYQAVTMLAIGFPAEKEPLTAEATARKQQHETRKAVKDFAFCLTAPLNNKKNTPQ